MNVFALGKEDQEANIMLSNLTFYALVYWMICFWIVLSIYAPEVKKNKAPKLSFGVTIIIFFLSGFLPIFGMHYLFTKATKR